MEISINVLAFYGAASGEEPVTPAGALERALADGWRVFDFPLAPMAFYDSDWRGEIWRALEVCARGGGEIRYTHLPFRFPWEAETEENWAAFDARMSCALEAAYMLGVRYAAFHPYTTQVPAECYDAAPCREAAVRHLLPWLEKADRLGVRICAENQQGDENCRPCRRYCARIEELCALADELRLPGIVWDSGHGHIAGHVQSEALRMAGKRVKLLHIHDNDGCRDLHLPPYQGSIDWEDFLHGLADIGFDGDLNYEQELRGIPSALRAPIIRYLRVVGESFAGKLRQLKAENA